MYVGEKKYVEDISKLKFEHEIHPILVGYDEIRDKRINDISATDIRTRPQKHWSKIAAPFRPYLTHKILITGTASEGKTTLVQDLQMYFQCPITTEYGRDYMSAKGITDTDLMFEDFLSFITGQNWYYKKALYSPANNGVIISDTDNLVTLMYAKAYSENPIMKITQDDYILLYEYVKKLEGDIKWDKIFVFSPRNKFVDDGSRFMGQSSINERQKNFDKLIKLLKDFNLMDKVEILDGDFFHNYNTIKTYISDLYQ
jgi:NadR type nicotinamide-nucleotide adenylyltransferase